MKQSVKMTLFSVAGAGIIALGVWGVTAATHAAALNLNGADQELPTASTTANITTPSATTPEVDRHQQRLDAMANLLGITSSQLQTELESGKQFYQIAAEHGITYDKLKADKDTRVKARLDDMVKVGYLTQAEADAAYQQYQTQAQQTPLGGTMGFGHGFHMHGSGF